jgi:hypothetical protein
VYKKNDLLFEINLELSTNGTLGIESDFDSFSTVIAANI